MSRWFITVAAVFCLSLFWGCVMEDIDDIGRMFDVPTPGQAARWALDQHDPDRRREGLVLLSTSTFGGAEVYLELYRDYVEHDPNPLVKSAAIAALARHGTPKDAILLASWTKRDKVESVTIRWAAVKGLQRLHNPDVVSDLRDVAIDVQEQSEVRSAACVAMAQYSEDRVIQALIISLDAVELSVNVDAAESLFMLTGQSLGLDHTAWQNWYVAAQKEGDPFAGMGTYHYPTYARDAVWWEYIAFWLDEQYEPPMRPIGMRDAAERRTWEDFEPGAATPTEVESTDDG